MQKRRRKNNNHNKRNKQIEKEIRQAQFFIAVFVLLITGICLQIN